MKAHTAEISLEKPTYNDVHPAQGQHPLSRKALVNQLNYIHFQEETIVCRFDHPDKRRTVSLALTPEPTFGSNLVCLWPKDIASRPFPEYRLKQISIPRRETVIDIEPDVKSITGKGFCLRLPEFGYPTPKREGNRHVYEHVGVRLNTETLSVMGRLEDIKGNRISVILDGDVLCDMAIYDRGNPVNIAFVKQGNILFTGQYHVLGAQTLGKGIRICLEPNAKVIHRFPPKKFRGARVSLSPTPDANFIHPFHGGYISMAVCDLSGAGFSVENPEDKNALLTGMVLRDLELNFAGAFSITCCAQVVHRCVKKTEEGHDRITYGFAFLDMSLDDHLKLSGLLHQRQDSHIRLCNTMDEKGLWAFFFETGFIYAKKYNAFTGNKAMIRETYRKLYSKSPSIARHLTYREDGDIVGHMSMLRLYQDSWLMHHHAALKRSSIKAGLAVLNHVGWFCYNSMWLDACHMRYMLCYFRPDNAFPNFFFNGFAERLNDPAGCSTDTFAYLSFRKSMSDEGFLGPDWSLNQASPEDLSHLSEYYTTRSGGLMIKALDLSPDFAGSQDLDKTFHDSGLKKERHLFALKKNGTLKAVLMVNVTDVAINMSDLSNCVTLIVIDDLELPKDIVNSALAKVSPLYEQNRFPVLIYPLSYADQNDIPYQKQYILWILATKYSDHYFEFLDQVNTLGSRKH